MYPRRTLAALQAVIDARASYTGRYDNSHVKTVNYHTINV